MPVKGWFFFTLVKISNKDSLACLTYVYTGVISEDPWYSYLLPILLQWISHNLFLYDLRLSQTKIESQSPIYEAKTINWQNKASLACLYRYLYNYKISTEAESTYIEYSSTTDYNTIETSTFTERTTKDEELQSTMTSPPLTKGLYKTQGTTILSYAEHPSPTDKNWSKNKNIDRHCNKYHGIWNSNKFIIFNLKQLYIKLKANLISKLKQLRWVFVTNW